MKKLSEFIAESPEPINEARKKSFSPKKVKVTNSFQIDYVQTKKSKETVSDYDVIIDGETFGNLMIDYTQKTPYAILTWNNDEYRVDAGKLTTESAILTEAHKVFIKNAEKFTAQFAAWYYNQ